MLPEDWLIGTFVGRIETTAGPSPILVRRGIAFDMSAVAPTVSALLDRRNSTGAAGVELGTLDALNLRAPDERSDPTLLAPVDLQCIKAAGVTFAVSAIERVIEERARGDAAAARDVRDRLEARMGGSMRSVVPGTAAAAELKSALIEQGLWSQYL